MPTFKHAKRIIETLVKEGHTAYFAGGWVRDFLMKRASNDIDIATTASVEEIQALFPKTIPVGVNFGIVVVVEGGHQFEVATFREDEGYVDGRRPTGVTPSSPEKDAQRRDFTINGMFFDPISQEIYDFIEGQKDLEAGIIRAIGNPHERFLEDRLRMIRAVRYATRFHFTIEEETIKAIVDHANLLFPAVAIERVWNEFCKMAASPHFDKALAILHKLGLLAEIFPSLEGVALEKRLMRLPFFPEEAPTIARILELFPAYLLEEKLLLCEKLRLSNKERTFVTFYHETTPLLTQELERYDWARLYANVDFPITLKLAATHLPVEERLEFLQRHHMQRKELERFIKRIEENNPVLKAKHLLEVGVQKGPRMGLLLKEGERIAINEGLEDPRQVIEKIRS